MSPCCISATNTKSLILCLLNSADFHLEVAETLCKINTKSKGNRKRKKEIEEGIEEKNIKGLLSICPQNQKTEIKLGTGLIG